MKSLSTIATKIYHSDPTRVEDGPKPRQVSPLRNQSQFIMGEAIESSIQRTSNTNPSKNESHLSSQSLAPVISTVNRDKSLETTGKVTNPFKNESHIKFTESRSIEAPRRRDAMGRGKDPNKNVSHIMPEMLPVTARPPASPDARPGKTTDPLRNKSQVLPLHPAACLPEIPDKPSSRLISPSKNQRSQSTPPEGGKKHNPRRNESQLVFLNSVSATSELSPSVKLLNPEKNETHFALVSGALDGFDFSPLARVADKGKNVSHLFEKLPSEPRVNQKLLFIKEFNKSHTEEATHATGLMRRDFPGRNDESKTCDPYRLI